MYHIELQTRNGVETWGPFSSEAEAARVAIEDLDLPQAFIVSDNGDFAIDAQTSYDDLGLGEDA